MITPYDRVIARLAEVQPTLSPRAASLLASDGRNADLIRAMKRGRSNFPRGDGLQGLAKLLQVDVSWLTALRDGEDGRHLDSEEVAASLDLDDHVDPAEPPFPGAIPQIIGRMGGGSTGDVVTINAGEMRTIAPVSAWWHVPAPALRALGVSPEHIAAWPQDGDSMEPTISRTDIVFIDTGRRDIEPDGIWAVDFGYGRTLKRIVFKKTKAGLVWVLKSDNQHYPPLEFSPDEVTVLGRYLFRFTAF